jgi:hypothetical protein
MFSRRGFLDLLSALWNFMFTGLVVFLYGPAAAVNRHYLNRHLANASTVQLRWIRVDPIATAWLMVPYGVPILVLYWLGADSAILGWLSILVIALVWTVMGTNPRFGKVAFWCIVIGLAAVVIALLLRDALINNGIIQGVLWLMFDSGMELNPVFLGVLIVISASLTVAETVQEVVMKHNFVDGNHFNVNELFGSRKPLKRDEWTPSEDTPDFLEYSLCSMVALKFEANDAAKTPIEQTHVPWGRPLVRRITQLAKAVDVEITK